MDLVTSISVFANLISIYEFFKKKGQKHKDTREILLQSIQTLSSYKDTHESSQQLREFCRSCITERIDRTSGASSFELKLRELNDRSFKFKKQFPEKFVSKDFDTEKIEIDLAHPLTESVKKVHESTKLIRTYVDQLSKIAAEIADWNLSWNQNQFLGAKDFDKFEGFIFTAEEPARLTLLFTDVAMSNSITIIATLADELI